MLKKLLTASLITLSFSASAGAIRFGYNQQYSAPHVINNGKGTSVSGIVIDVSNAISQEAGFMAKQLPLPRKRIEQYLIDGKIDAQCHANPVWYNAPSIIWSEVLYSDADIIVSDQAIASLQALSSHKQFKLGTVLGYKYPNLTEYFAAGNLKRFNSTSSKDSLTRFTKGELDGFVASYSEANYLTRLRRFNVLEVNSYDLHCSFSPKLNAEKRQRLIDAAHKLRDNGEFERVFAKYIKPE